MEVGPKIDCGGYKIANILFHKAPLELYFRLSIGTIHHYDDPVAYIQVSHPLITVLDDFCRVNGYNDLHKNGLLRVKIKKATRHGVPCEVTSGIAIAHITFQSWYRGKECGVTPICRNLEYTQ